MFMDQKGISDQTDDHKMDDVMLPGFRFHPTDEELVGFYLKKKIQHRSLPIELIKQVDIYKYDPWDLPNLAPSGEKEWYFYCPRDRKYKNSTRPNRVTGAGFWKATGTDRPIYSSDGTKCIGLKKSLVFYRGRAAKGIKTDWMMHEFRLPSPPEPTSGKKNIQDKNLPPNDGWAICRIFKKMNSMAQRPLNYQSSLITQDNSWSDFLITQPSSSSINTFSGLENTFIPPAFADFRIEPAANNVVASSSMVINLDCYYGGGGTNNNSDHDQSTGLEAFDNFPVEHYYRDQEVGNGGFPLSFPATDEWKVLHMGWDSPPTTCASESTTTTYSTNRSHN